MPCVHGGVVGRGRIPCGGRSSGPEPRVSPAKRPSPGAGSAGLTTTIPPLPRVLPEPSCGPRPAFGSGETSRKHTRVLGWPELRTAVCSRGALGVWWGRVGHVLLSRTVTGSGSVSGSLVRVWVVLVFYVECPHLRSGPQGPSADRSRYGGPYLRKGRRIPLPLLSVMIAGSTHLPFQHDVLQLGPEGLLMYANFTAVSWGDGCVRSVLPRRSPDVRARLGSSSPSGLAFSLSVRHL